MAKLVGIGRLVKHRREKAPKFGASPGAPIPGFQMSASPSPQPPATAPHGKRKLGLPIRDWFPAPRRSTRSLFPARIHPVIGSVCILITFLCFSAAFLLLAVINRIELVPWLKSDGEHWTERSRILWPARRTNAILILYVPLLLAVGSKLLADTSLLGLLPRWAAAMAGATGANWFVVRRVYPDVSLRIWLHDLAVGLILRLGIWLVFFGVAFSMPDEFNLRTWFVFVGFIVVQIVWTIVVIRLLRVAGIVRPAGDRLRKIVADCVGGGVPRVKAVWQAGGVSANAFALPISGTLVFHDRLLDHLDDEEVSSICAHELGHLAESKLILAGRYLGAMAVLPLLLIRPAVAYWEFPGALAMFVLMVIWARLSRKLVHRMEIRADAIASVHQEDGSVYARALEKIYQLGRLPAVTSGNQATHPHLYDRMLAAGAVPDFPRPLASGRFTPLGWFMLFAGPVGLVWMYCDGFQARAGRGHATREVPAALPSPAGGGAE